MVSETPRAQKPGCDCEEGQLHVQHCHLGDSCTGVWVLCGARVDLKDPTGRRNRCEQDGAVTTWREAGELMVQSWGLGGGTG